MIAARDARRLVLLLGLLGAACGEGGSSGQGSPAAAAPAPTRSVEVTTARVTRGTLPLRLTAPGTLAARRQSEIGAEVTGLIERVLVDVGDRVEEGQELFRIDDSSYAAALRQAQAGAELARSERSQIETELARALPLRERDVLTEQQLERIETQLAVARARERQAAAAVAVARQNLERTRVRAPYAGTVARRLADEGTTARSMPQTIVLVLQETGELEGEAFLPESHQGRVRVGDRALLFADGVAAPIETSVAAVADTIDAATRTFLVRMRVPNPKHRYKAGTFVRVEILPAALQETLLVPRAAIRSEAGSTSVLCVREGRAVEVPVRLGLISEETAELLAGLEPDEEVIVGEAARELAPGTAVRVRAAAGSAP